MSASLLGVGLMAGASALSNIGSGVIGGLFNRHENALNRQFTREESQKARDFEERMSNTAYQRSVADLEKSGLNKMLAYSSPSSTPTANSGSMQASQGALDISDRGVLSRFGDALLSNSAKQQKLETERAWLDSRTAYNNAKIVQTNYDIEQAMRWNNRTKVGF